MLLHLLLDTTVPLPVWVWELVRNGLSSLFYCTLGNTRVDASVATRMQNTCVHVPPHAKPKPCVCSCPFRSGPVRRWAGLAVGSLAFAARNWARLGSDCSLLNLRQANAVEALLRYVDRPWRTLGRLGYKVAYIALWGQSEEYGQYWSN